MHQFVRTKKLYCDYKRSWITWDLDFPKACVFPHERKCIKEQKRYPKQYHLTAGSSILCITATYLHLGDFFCKLELHSYCTHLCTDLKLLLGIVQGRLVSACSNWILVCHFHYIPSERRGEVFQSELILLCKEVNKGKKKDSTNLSPFLSSLHYIFSWLQQGTFQNTWISSGKRNYLIPNVQISEMYDLTTVRGQVFHR